MTLPYGDRSDTILEPRLTDQWYINAEALAQPAIQAVENGKTRFVPEFWSSTYFEWMRNIQPWCISRQLWWGHRIPAWYGPDGAVFVAETVQEATTKAHQHYGTSVALVQDEDVLDTWFSSSLWPFVTLGWPERTPELAKNYPSSVLITGNDIIFFWVARMMMMGLYCMKEVPFKDVYIHALVRDEKGQKMSKSKGNIVDPVELIEKFGADALRFTLALQAAPGRDIKFSISRIEGARNFMTKLWNATRFCHMNGCTEHALIDPQQITHPVNAWIVEQVKQLQANFFAALEGYRFHEASQLIYQEIWGTFCDWYLEFTKPLLASQDARLVLETQQTTQWALAHYLHMLNPFMPFITEALWGVIFGKPLVEAKLAITPFEDLSTTQTSTPTSSVTWARTLIEEIRSTFAMLSLPNNVPYHAIFLTKNASELTWLQEYRPLIERMARLESLTAQCDALTSMKDGELYIPYGEGYLAIVVGTVLDMKKEADRLASEINKLSKEIHAMEAKFANPDFLARAPDDVVGELRERHREATLKVTKLEAARERFLTAARP